jgi:ribosomal protein S5
MTMQLVVGNAAGYVSAGEQEQKQRPEAVGVEIL